MNAFTTPTSSPKDTDRLTDSIMNDLEGNLEGNTKESYDERKFVRNINIQHLIQNTEYGKDTKNNKKEKICPRSRSCYPTLDDLNPPCTDLHTKCCGGGTKGWYKYYCNACGFKWAQKHSNFDDDEINETDIAIHDQEWLNKLPNYQRHNKSTKRPAKHPYKCTKCYETFQLIFWKKEMHDIGAHICPAMAETITLRERMLEDEKRKQEEKMRAYSKSVKRKLPIQSASYQHEEKKLKTSIETPKHESQLQVNTNHNESQLQVKESIKLPQKYDERGWYPEVGQLRTSLLRLEDVLRMSPYQFEGCPITQAFHAKILYVDGKQIEKETYVIIDDLGNEQLQDTQENRTLTWRICADTEEAVEVLEALTSGLTSGNV